jgi:hypothetical protein
MSHNQRYYYKLREQCHQPGQFCIVRHRSRLNQPVEMNRQRRPHVASTALWLVNAWINPFGGLAFPVSFTSLADAFLTGVMKRVPSVGGKHHMQRKRRPLGNPVAPRAPDEIRELLLKLAHENDWGYSLPSGTPPEEPVPGE